jgi:outer membrane protein TolC
LRKADLGEAEAERKHVGLTDKDLIKTIYKEVESAYFDFTTQKSILKSLEEQVSFGRENYNLVAKRWWTKLSMVG